MRICKHCNAEVEDDILVCPECGADMLEDEQTSAETAAPAEETPAEQPAPQEEPKKKAPWGLIVGLVLAALVVVGIIIGKSALDQKKEEAPTEAQTETEASADGKTPVEENLAPELTAGHHTNLAGLPSHTIIGETAEDGTMKYYYIDETGANVTVSREELDALLDTVVAAYGDQTLTNRDLIYLKDQYTYFILTSQMGSMLGSMIDPSVGLDEQMLPDGTMTWEQYFITGAQELFHRMAAFYDAAVAAGHTLTEEEESFLDVETTLADAAAQAGFADAEALLKAQIGPTANVADYAKFAAFNTLAGSYANKLSEEAMAKEVAPEEIDAYYQANTEMLQSSYGVGPSISVRHILIEPEKTVLEDGTEEISEEAWAAAEARAQELYEQWQSGDATEDAFAALASENTADPGSKGTGGLYEGVFQGQMVPEFDAWCFEDGRQAGDHGIVKTQFGYHIMYFVSQNDYSRDAVREIMLAEQAMAEQDALVEACTGSQDLSKVVTVANPIPVPEEEPEVDAPAPEGTEEP